MKEAAFAAQDLAERLGVPAGSDISELRKLLEVAEAARNVVAQWRGDISREPHIGRLREALVALNESEGE
jgi:hypothetical protein